MTASRHAAPPPLSGSTTYSRTDLGSHWNPLSARERMMLRAATTLGALALLWWAGLQPALRIRHEAQETLPRLQAQLQTMQALQQQAAQVRTLPALDPGQAQALFAQACRTYGIPETLLVTNGPSTVDLQGVEPAALARWLESLRVNVRIRPVRVQLRRDMQGLWSGSVQLQGS